MHVYRFPLLSVLFSPPIEMMYLDDRRVMMKWHIPLAEIISDFFDVLKEVSSGFASLEYEEIGYRPTELVKVGHFRT